MASCGSAARIDQRLLSYYEIGIGRQFAAADLTRERSQIGHAVASVNDGRLAGLGGGPRHRARQPNPS